jgi:cyclin B
LVDDLQLAEVAVGGTINIHVLNLGGAQVLPEIDRSARVFHLRRIIADALACPLTQLILVHGAKVLHGMQAISDVFGIADSAEVLAVVTDTGGPAEEIMDFEDPRRIAEYLPDIYCSLLVGDAMPQQPLNPCGVMEQQPDINTRMRGILIDWLVEVIEKYSLSVPTLFLTVSLIDRYLERKHVERKRLQLLGMVSLLIASKLEDIHPPTVGDLVYICDSTSTRREILNFEAHMLSVLDFDLLIPTPATFLELYLNANRCDSRHRNLVQYILELSLVEPFGIRCQPSHLVSAAVLLSNQLLKREEVWPESMICFTTFHEDALATSAHEMHDRLKKVPTARLQAVRNKYSRASRDSIASIQL